jgi:small subunit ribosomal protein S11
VFLKKNIILRYSKKNFSTNEFFYLKEKKTRLILHKDFYNFIKFKRGNKFILNFTKGFYILYIRSSLRGLHINISDINGKALKVFTLGLFGYTKAKRYNTISLRSLSEGVLNYLNSLDPGLENLVIYFKGFNSKRNNIVNFLLKSSIKSKISSIVDLSDVPYNGCRPKKLRRK